MNEVAFRTLFSSFSSITHSIFKLILSLPFGSALEHVSQYIPNVF
jgi:hypothetical protein